MTAQGGDPEAMTLTQYLDLAYAVVVDEHVRRGDTLFDALEYTKGYAARRAGVAAPVTAGGSQQRQQQRRQPEPESGIGGPGEPASATDIANAEAMRTLMGAMGGVQGGFK